MTPNEISHRSKQGVLLAIAAYSIWGLAPLYFKTVAHVPALEVLAHRIIWSFFLVLILLVLSKRFTRVLTALRSPKQLAALAVATVLIGFNWFLFIWAVSNDFILDASLGYFINPLFNVLLGVIIFGERLRRLQTIAVALAFSGVAIQIIMFGSIPWIALALASSFAIYGAVRKKLPFDSLTGLWLEVALLLPVTLLYFAYFANSDASHLLENSWQLNTLLMLAGVITTVPLLCFTAAAQRLRYSTMGFFQYIGPSLMFLVAIFVYQEPLQTERLLTFLIIWSALVLYSYDALRNHKQRTS